jgi:hypothetical protein
VIQRVQHRIQTQTKLGSLIKLAGNSPSFDYLQTNSTAKPSGNASIQLRSTSVGRQRIGQFGSRMRDEKTTSTDYAQSLYLLKPQVGTQAPKKQLRTLKDVFQAFGLSKRLLPSKLPEHFTSAQVSAAMAVPATPSSFRLSNKPPPFLYETLTTSRTGSPPLTSNRYS